MSGLYGDQHLAMRDKFDTRKMAERVGLIIVLPEIDDNHKVARAKPFLDSEYF